MKGHIAVTDNDWFAFLSQQREIDEVIFWQPGGTSRFRSLSPGEPFFFKLHAPYHFIVGGGFFTHSTILPVSLAWSALRIKNGASSCSEMRRLIERNRHSPPSQEDYKIGCILLTQPFFFERQQDWIEVPADFSLNIVRGKTYDLSQGYGRSLCDFLTLKILSCQPNFQDDKNSPFLCRRGRKRGPRHLPGLPLPLLTHFFLALFGRLC